MVLSGLLLSCQADRAGITLTTVGIRHRLGKAIGAGVIAGRCVREGAVSIQAHRTVACAAGQDVGQSSTRCGADVDRDVRIEDGVFVGAEAVIGSREILDRIDCQADRAGINLTAVGGGHGGGEALGSRGVRGWRGGVGAVVIRAGGRAGPRSWWTSRYPSSPRSNALARGS